MKRNTTRKTSANPLVKQALKIMVDWLNTSPHVKWPFKPRDVQARRSIPDFEMDVPLGLGSNGRFILIPITMKGESDTGFLLVIAKQFPEIKTRKKKLSDGQMGTQGYKTGKMKPYKIEYVLHEFDGMWTPIFDNTAGTAYTEPRGEKAIGIIPQDSPFYLPINSPRLAQVPEMMAEILTKLESLNADFNAPRVSEGVNDEWWTVTGEVDSHHWLKYVQAHDADEAAAEAVAECIRDDHVEHPDLDGQDEDELRDEIEEYQVNYVFAGRINPHNPSANSAAQVIRTIDILATMKPKKPPEDPETVPPGEYVIYTSGKIAEGEFKGRKIHGGSVNERIEKMKQADYELCNTCDHEQGRHDGPRGSCTGNAIECKCLKFVPSGKFRVNVVEDPETVMPTGHRDITDDDGPKNELFPNPLNVNPTTKGN